MTDESLQFGLLMESAQAHQRLAEAQLAALHAHVQGLDEVVRDVVKRTLIEELQPLHIETDGTVRALRIMRRSLMGRGLMLNGAIVAVLSLAPVVVTRFIVPSPAEIAGMRARRDELAQNLAELTRRGGQTEWRRCGAANRLCVRVDRSAPAFGEQSDFFIVKGY